jgi:hypothetical protein
LIDALLQGVASGVDRGYVVLFIGVFTYCWQYCNDVAQLVVGVAAVAVVIWMMLFFRALQAVLIVVM